MPGTADEIAIEKPEMADLILHRKLDTIGATGAWSPATPDACCSESKSM
jgi:hypothetical protein